MSYLDFVKPSHGLRPAPVVRWDLCRPDSQPAPEPEPEPEATPEPVQAEPRDFLWVTTEPEGPASVRQVKAMVADAYDVSVADLEGRKGSKQIVQARQAAMLVAAYACRNQSLPRIASRFGDRDHTTALHAIRKGERQIIALLFVALIARGRR